MSDINITTINPTTRRVTFSFNTVPAKTTGIETLLQLSAKTVLTTPGRDVFASAYGGGLMDYAGHNLSSSMLPRVYADVAYIISKSQEQIIFEQTGKNIPKEERLKSLTILSIIFLEEEGALDVRVLVTSEAGDEVDISLANQIRFRRDE